MTCSPTSKMPRITIKSIGKKIKEEEEVLREENEVLEEATTQKNEEQVAHVKT